MAAAIFAFPGFAQSACRIFLLCLLMSLWGTPAWANDAANVPVAAGKIDLITGELQILPLGKPAHVARVGDAVFEGDTLITGKDSETHLTMADTGFLALRANTRLQIISFKADGGDTDNGVFKLATGALRSISGWIGKFNRKSYLLRTPTATIGIRGTDHETRYVPPGSNDGEAGTYDKVFFGETTIQSDTGQTAVLPDQAGYAANEGAGRPQVLPQVPGFFRPGPHEDIINRKHAEIQQMIMQRREERRRVVEQKLALLLAARHDMQAQVVANKAAAEQRSAAEKEQRENSAEQLAALRTRSEALQQSVAAVQELRRTLQPKLQKALRTNADLREHFKAVWETGKAIGKEYVEIREARKALTEKNLAANEARKAAAEEQRTQNETQLAALGEQSKALQERQRAIDAQHQALKDKKPVGQQRKALADATDALLADQRANQAAYSTLFDNNLAATEARLRSVQALREQTEEQNAAFGEREAALQERQRINEDKLEALQARAIERLGGDEKLGESLKAIHDGVEVIRMQRSEVQAMRKSLQDRNVAAAEQRQTEALQQLDALRVKHSEVAAKNVDLQNERESMRDEIRGMIEQEQKRYREELRADREQGALPADMSAASNDGPVD